MQNLSMGGKLYIKTFGCQMNEYDSARTAELLEASHGLERTERPEQADVLLINTCSVREKAQEKVFSQLGQWREWKVARPHLVLGVGGCVASQEGEAIRTRAPYVDLVFGPQTLHRVPAMLSEARAAHRPRVDVSFPAIEKFDHLPAPRADGVTAYVSIMEGCSRRCAYCVVPFTRGPETSRPLADVLAEVRLLAEQGVREMTFLGQNVNAYRGASSTSGRADLATLIARTAEIAGVERIRFTTSHPARLDHALIDAYACVPQLASHLHLPVQSGSDRVLKAMRRGYSVAGFLDRVRRLRAARPEISLTTDLIVGFPGETEADFQATLDLIDEAGFDNAFSFVFSPRPGTAAATLADPVPMDEKKRWLSLLQARVEDRNRQFGRALVDSVQRVLVEGPSKRRDAEISGRIECNRVVNFPGGRRLVGQVLPVRITEARPNSLRGELAVAEPPAAACA